MEATLAPARAALGKRTFVAYLAVSALADCGFWIAVVAQGWLVVRLAHSPFWLGAIGTAAQFPALVVSLVGGVLADRVDRRLAIAATEIGIGLIAAVTAFFAARDGLNVWGLLALTLATGTLLAIEHPIDRAFIYDLIDGDDVEHSVAFSSLEFGLARTAGPALGGVAVATFGIAGGYALQTACVVPIVTFALDAFRRKIAAAAQSPTTRARAHATSLGDAWRFLVRERAILSVCAIVAAFTIGVTPYIALLADIAKNVLHLREGGYGALQAAGGAGAFAGALALALNGEPKHVRGTIAGAVLVASVALAIFTSLRSPLGAGAALVVLGAVDAIVYALANAYVQERTVERFRGRVNAIFTIAFLGGIPIGNLALGAIAARIGSERALGASSLVVAACAVAFWCLKPAAGEPPGSAERT